MPVLAELAWPILERIHLFGGGFAISPHGIFVALGFLAGAQFMLKRARQRGVSRRPDGPQPDLIVQGIVTRAAIGAIIGARLFYVVTRLDQFPDPLSWFAIWEGGLSLLGGIAGAMALDVPYVLRNKVDLRLNLDNFASGMSLGIFIGRVGDLIIGEHLGAATDFGLGWRCTGNLTAGAVREPLAYTGPMVQGCFDTAVHQTALYDFLAGGVIFALIVWLERKPRWDGFSFTIFAVGYGAFRFVSDFAREADRDLVGTFTGSQLTAIAVIVGVALWVRVVKPWERTPWAWDPPDFDHPWRRPAPPEEADEAADDLDEDAEEPIAEEPPPEAEPDAGEVDEGAEPGRTAREKA